MVDEWMGESELTRWWGEGRFGEGRQGEGRLGEGLYDESLWTQNYLVKEKKYYLTFKYNMTTNTAYFQY